MEPVNYSYEEILLMNLSLDPELNILNHQDGGLLSQGNYFLNNTFPYQVGHNVIALNGLQGYPQQIPIQLHKQHSALPQPNSSIYANQFLNGDLAKYDSFNLNLQQYQQHQQIQAQMHQQHQQQQQSLQSQLVQDSQDVNKKQKKRRLLTASVSVSSLDDQKNAVDTAFKMYRALFTSDIRRAYPKLLEDALNTSNLQHLSRVINLMCDSECKRMQGKIVVNQQPVLGFIDREFSGSTAIYRYMVAITNSIPDAVFHIHEFRIRYLAHVPNAFTGIPVDFFEDSNAKRLDDLLIEKARSAGVDASSGFCIIGRYSFSGTQVFEFQDPLNNTQSSLTNISAMLLSPTFSSSTSSRFTPNIQNSGLLLWVMKPDNKISRWESYTDPDNIQSSTVTKPDDSVLNINVNETVDSSVSRLESTTSNNADLSSINQISNAVESAICTIDKKS